MLNELHIVCEIQSELMGNAIIVTTMIYSSPRYWAQGKAVRRAPYPLDAWRVWRQTDSLYKHDAKKWLK